jgi:MoaA/NifB/PqqE/SkfB family radical SAM enzyme
MVMKENMDNIDEIKEFCKNKNILFTCRLPEKLGTAKESWDTLIAGSLKDEEKMKNIAMKHSLGGEVFRTDYGCLFWVAGVLLGVDGKARLCYSLNNRQDFGNIKTDSMLEIIKKKNVVYKPRMDYFCPIHAEMV